MDLLAGHLLWDENVRSVSYRYPTIVRMSSRWSGGPDREGRPRKARGEPPGSGAAATAAEPALQIIEGNAMLNSPRLSLRDIDRIGQSPRRLVGKVWPARVTQHVDDVLPAVLFRSHEYHQPLPRPDVAVTPGVRPVAALGGHCFARTT